MKLSNKNYDLLKRVVQIVMPALITFIGTVGTALGWEFTDITMTIVGAVTAFLGATLGVSNANYKKEEL